jgi:hypothetical protein
MSEFNARLASKGEIRGISDWFLEERSKYPGMSQLVGRGMRGWMVRNVVTPRYMRKVAYTYVLEQDGKTGGFAVVEQGGLAVNLSDFAIREGFDRAGLVTVMLAQVEQLAREREYHYVRATPWDSSETALAPFYQAGFELLDYYLWVFTGQVSGMETPKDVTLVELAAKTALERRLHFLGKELDASQVAGRDLIEAVFFPKKPSTYRAYRVETVDVQGGEPSEIGYLSPRPNERSDGVLTLSVSLEPEAWGTDLEMQTVGGFASEVGPDQPVRVLVCTSLHADRAEESYRKLGLTRELDLRPVLYKDVRSDTP